MIFVHDVSPVLVEFGGFGVRWYGLLFAVGVFLNYLIMRWAFKKAGYSLEKFESVIVYLFFGLVIGARLGHVFFYKLSYYLDDPVSILKIWNGGLSSHGAAIGIIVAYFIWTKIYKVGFSKYADAIVLPMPLTAAIVRVGNFFNSEIVGFPTDGTYGVVFKRLGEDFPRHPSQLYEAVICILIFAILFFSYKFAYRKTKPLFFLFFFIGVYFSGRFITEFFKDLHGPLTNISWSMGQILSIAPLTLAFVYFVGFFPRMKKRKG